MTVRKTWVLFAVSLAIVAVFYVLREHWAHAIGVAPYLLLLACPVLHLFHGHHGGGHRHSDGPERSP
jgi:hypothetical protein